MLEAYGFGSREGSQERKVLWLRQRILLRISLETYPRPVTFGVTLPAESRMQIEATISRSGRPLKLSRRGASSTYAICMKGTGFGRVLRKSYAAILLSFDKMFQNFLKTCI